LNVIALFMPVILCFTVVAAVALGIFSAYAAVITILRAFGRNSHAAPARLVLVPTQTHASGD
jgi:hypothetical protein